MGEFGGLLPPVLIKFVGDTAELSKGISESEGRLGAMNKAFSTFGKVGALALAGVGAESVHLAMNFDASMEMIHTQAGVAQDQIKGLSNGVLKLAGQVGEGPDSLAEALYHIESQFAGTGLTGAKAMALLKTSAEGAKIGGANLVDVTNALGAAMTAQIPGDENLDKAMGMLNATVGAGDMHMQDLADAMGGGMIAVIKGYGLSMRDASAALALFGDNNIRGAAAGTALRMSVQALATPAAGKAAREQLAALGLTSKTLAKDMQTGGLNKALTDLHDRLQKAGITGTQAGAVLTTMFGKKAGTGVNVLMDQYDKLQNKYEEVDRGGNQFAASWAATQDTFKNKVDRLKASAESLGIQIGNKLIPPLTALGDWFARHKNITEGLVAAIGALMALSIVVWMANVAKSAAQMGKAVLLAAKDFILAGEESEAAFAVNPVFLVIAAVVALGVAIYEIVKHWSTVKRWLSDFWGWMKVGWRDTIGWLKKNWEIVAAILILPLAPFLLAWRFFHKQIVDAAQATWRFLQPVFRGIATGLNILLIPLRLQAAMWIWLFRAMIIPTVLWAWRTVISPTFHLIAAAFDVILGFALRLFVGAWRIGWNILSSVVSWAWKNLLGPTFHLIGTGLDLFIGAQLRLFKAGWDLLWRGIKDTVDVAWKFLKPIFDVIGKGIGLISTAAGKVGGIIGKANKILPFAEGGSPPVGRAVLVGERGPELAVFGGSAYIHTASQTRSILAGGKASGGWVGSASSWGSATSGGGSRGSQQPPDIVVQVDGVTLFRIVQKQALRNQRRNINNGLQIA